MKPSDTTDKELQKFKKYTWKAIDKLHKHDKMTEHGGVKMSQVKKLLCKKFGDDEIALLWTAKGLKQKVKEWTLEKVIDIANKKQTDDVENLDRTNVSQNSKKRKREEEIEEIEEEENQSESDTRPVVKDVGIIPDFVALDDIGARRLSVRQFKRKTYVDIREMYVDASRELKPGKKGIMLTLDQWNRLAKSVETVQRMIAAQK